MKPFLINSIPSLFSLIFLNLLIISAISLITPRETSEQMYVVKLNKITEEQRQKIDANREVISKGELLQKLMSFTPVDSETAIFFVKYNSIVNPSRRGQNNKDNSTKGNRASYVLLQIQDDKNVIDFNNSQIKPVQSSLVSVSSSKTVQILKQPNNNVQTQGPNTEQKTTGQPKVIRQDTIELRRPVIQKKIVNAQFKGQFSGLDLYHQVPSVFIKNQVYLFRGNVTNTSLIYFPTYLVQAVMLKNGKEKIKCEQFVTKNNPEFQLSCRMRQTGTYKLVIKVGFVLFTHPKTLQIKQPEQKISLTAIPKTPEGLYLQLIQNVLYIGWLTTSSLSRLTFLQRGRSQQYLLSNYHYRFKIPFVDFLLFENGQMKVLLDHAQSIDGTYNTISSNFGDKLLLIFNAMTHGHSDNDQGSYKIQPMIPWRVKVNETIQIKTTFKSKLKNQIYFVSPYGRIQKQYIDRKFSSDRQALVNANTPLQFNISFQLQGTNTIQINLAEGAAAINQPVYVGDGFPILPDFKDIVYQSKLNNQDYTKALIEFVKVRYGKNPNFPMKQQPNYNATISQKRQFLMNLLNLIRAVQIVEPVYLDDLLSHIAQLHCQDMKKQSYFSHINKKNEGPSERAKKFNFSFVLGQNLAERDTLIEAHLSLKRSAIHFENSIDKIWTRVGLGICQRPTGQYITVYVFSTRDTTKFPLNSYELLSFKKQMVEMIERKYKKKQREQFSNIVLQWMLSPREIALNYYVKNKNAGGMIVDYNCLQFIFYPLFISQFENSSKINKMITKNLLYSNTFAVNIIQSRGDKDLLQLCFGGIV